MFVGMDTMAEMRTKITQLVSVGGVIPGSPPSVVRPFLSHPHLARTCRFLVRLGYEKTNYGVHAFGGSLRIILGIPETASFGAQGMNIVCSVLSHMGT